MTANEQLIVWRAIKPAPCPTKRNVERRYKLWITPHIAIEETFFVGG
jgi:hypothetical protein